MPLATITAFLASLKELYPIKCIVSTSSAILITLFGGENQALYQALFILVMVDFFSGLIRVIKTEEKFTLAQFKNTISKLILYSLLLIATYQVQKISVLLIWVDDFSATFIAVTELLSITENLSKAGVLIPKWVRKKLEKYLDTGDFK